VSPEVFIDFGILKLAADGSDSYIMGAVETALRTDDPLWSAGVFTTFYAPPAQEFFCNWWSRRDVLDHPAHVLDWVTRNWKGLPLSGARRTGAFTPVKVMAALMGWAEYLEFDGPYRLTGYDFDEAFTMFLRNVPYHGRYTGLKLYETVRRLGAPLALVDNIVPRGGKTPRKGLTMIFPQHPYAVNDDAALREANELADELRKELHTTWFNVEMLLCNFGKAVKGSYYPGHAVDRELAHAAKAEGWFGERAGELRAVRQDLYPRVCLGEHNDWFSTRKELERCYAAHGYFWSDLLYDYGKTTDLSQPYRRDIPTLTSLRGYGEEL
jgi:hypothetical protein